MAGIRATLSPTAPIQSGTAAQTVLQLRAPAQQRLLIRAWGIFFKGNVPSDVPVTVELVRQSSAGTMSALTPKKCNDSDAETLQATAGQNATVEPVLVDVLEVKDVHPQSGYEKIYPFGGEQPVKGGSFLGIRVTAAVDVPCHPWIEYEE